MEGNPQAGGDVCVSLYPQDHACIETDTATKCTNDRQPLNPRVMRKGERSRAAQASDDGQCDERSGHDNWRNGQKIGEKDAKLKLEADRLYFAWRLYFTPLGGLSVGNGPFYGGHDVVGSMEPLPKGGGLRVTVQG